MCLSWHCAKLGISAVDNLHQIVLVNLQQNSVAFSFSAVVGHAESADKPGGWCAGNSGTAADGQVQLGRQVRGDAQAQALL